MEAEISSSTRASKHIRPWRHQLNEPVIMCQREVFLLQNGPCGSWRKLTEAADLLMKLFLVAALEVWGKMDHVKRTTLLLSSGWTPDVFLLHMNQHEGKELETKDSEAVRWAGLEKLTQAFSIPGHVSADERACGVMWCSNTELLFIYSSLQGSIYLVWQLDSWDQAIMCDKPSGESVQTHQSVNMSLSL